MVDSMIESETIVAERSGIHKKQMMMFPPLPDVEHLGSSPNDALRAMIHFAEAAVKSAHQHGDDNRIVAESALRLVAKILHSEKLTVLVEALKKANAVCNNTSGFSAHFACG